MGLQAEPVAEIVDRLSMPIPECGCYAWLGKHGTHGYPNIAYRPKPGARKHRKAATVIWELSNASEVPKGLEISHLCGQEWCVNPNHLTVETHIENLKRRREFDHRTWGGLCKQGHALPPLNERNQNGSCPICYRAYQAAYRLRKRRMQRGAES